MKYKLKNIALIAEIFGGIAILISLIFVGIQFKDNTKATRSATATATISTMASWYSDIGNNEQSSILFYKFLATPDSIPKEQRVQAIYNLHSMFLTFQNSYLLVKEGTLDVRIQESLTEVIKGVGSVVTGLLDGLWRKPMAIQQPHDGTRTRAPDFLDVLRAAEGFE